MKRVKMKQTNVEDQASAPGSGTKRDPWLTRLFASLRDLRKREKGAKFGRPAPSLKVGSLRAIRSVPRRLALVPHYWARIVFRAFPRAIFRLRRGSWEVLEPGSGFVRGSGKSRRAALRSAARGGAR